MDVLGMYLLQRVSDELTIEKNRSFERTFISQVPGTAARAVGEGYLSTSKEAFHRVTEGSY